MSSGWQIVKSVQDELKVAHKGWSKFSTLQIKQVIKRKQDVKEATYFYVSVMSYNLHIRVVQKRRLFGDDGLGLSNMFAMK